MSVTDLFDDEFWDDYAESFKEWSSDQLNRELDLATNEYQDGDMPHSIYHKTRELIETELNRRNGGDANDAYDRAMKGL